MVEFSSLMKGEVGGVIVAVVISFFFFFFSKNKFASLERTNFGFENNNIKERSLKKKKKIRQLNQLSYK